ncbi:haloacid dehalogenase [Aureimonas sp. SA4125]|uniref:TIGR01459 family HAD-type hydrolase n=1 Tax=Aureimonas sp. SA4125 TaxID=2826993 RepID=UPI001CC40EB0|nr:TIGR01459 family HAD-type hydrolase [Aureimonas sp. SA4125]BDA82812.1 haloacid dehalogenase [Aureimonas sp. SA4125]
MTQLQSIDGLAAVAGGYDAIFCDVWGVVHDGEKKSPSAEAALAAARTAGCRVFLLTNSPRRAESVASQLDAFGVARSAYDGIVTSGDVTRALIARAGKELFHLGPARDVDLFADLDVALVPADKAEAVVCTGLVNDEVETPEDYAATLAQMQARGLPMICANPDIVVHRGDRLIWCAGALARDYVALGGDVRMAGKPYRPIYEEACLAAAIAPGQTVLAIGDGLNTDIRGANDFGLDVLLIVGGIHGAELGSAGGEPRALERLLAEQDLTARYFMPSLA